MIAVGIVLTGFGVAVAWTHAADVAAFVPFAVMNVYFAIVFGWLIAAGVTTGRALRTQDRRPARFAPAGGGFVAWPAVSPALLLVPPMMLCAVAAVTLLTWPAPDPLLGWVTVALIALFALLIVAQVVSIWRGQATMLTTAGIRYSGPWFSRVIPWEALAPGGPLPTHLTDRYLPLAVVRPDLVVQRGWPIGQGSRKRPVLPLAFNVHPLFLTDAIRWYAEHAEDRVAIGTPAEHDRLVAALAPASAAR